MTQRERVIQYIKDFGSITAWEAMKELGIMQLAARMCELKDEGYEFLKSTEKGKTDTEIRVTGRDTG